jgi:hypothetical protein
VLYFLKIIFQAAKVREADKSESKANTMKQKLAIPDYLKKITK